MAAVEVLSVSTPLRQSESPSPEAIADSFMPQSSPRAMLPHSLAALRQAIHCGDSISVEEDGSWSTRWKVTHAVREFFGFAKEDDLALARFFETYLNSLEVKSATFINGIAAASRNDVEIELTRKAIISRLKAHKLKEEASISVTKEKNGESCTKTLRELIEESKFLKEQLTEQTDAVTRAKIEEELFHVQAAIREARNQADAALGIHRLIRLKTAIETRGNEKRLIYMGSQTKTKEFKAEFEANKKWLEKDLLAWKTAEKKKPHMRRELTQRDKEKIRQTCFYPKFVALLKEDPAIRDSYFKFVFRNTADGGRDAVDIFVQLPLHCERIVTSFLDKREGRLHDLFHIAEESFHASSLDARPGLRKYVTLKMDGKSVPIFNDAQEVVFDAGKRFEARRTIGEIFASLAKKNEVMGEFECVQDKGIVRAHSPINPKFFDQPEESGIDLTLPDWQKQLQVYETISYEEVIKRYGVIPQHGLIVVRASRGQAIVDKEGNPLPDNHQVQIGDAHSWFDIVTPQPDGSYAIFPIGKYATVWPKGLLDTFFYIFNTQRGQYRADENTTYNQRHQAAYALKATPDQMQRFWDKLKEDFKQERDNEVVFQAQGDNCGAWCQRTLEHVFGPNIEKFFDISYLDAQAPMPVSYIIAFLQFLTDYVWSVIASIMHIFICTILGAFRGYTAGEGDNTHTVRLLQYDPFMQGRLSLPGQLFKHCHYDSQENGRGYYGPLKIGHPVPHIIRSPAHSRARAAAASAK